MLCPVLIAHCITDAIGFELAVLAHQVIPRRLLLDAHIDGTVVHSSEVGFRACLTLVKAAGMDCQPEDVLEEWTCC